MQRIALRIIISDLSRQEISCIPFCNRIANRGHQSQANESVSGIEKSPEKSQSEGVKAYETIPGPKGPLGLGNIFRYMPLVGKYSWEQLHHASHDKYERYGPIVKETMVPGEDIVWLYDPKDIAILLTSKSFPLRRSHLALAHYRSQRPKVYRSGGLLAT